MVRQLRKKKCDVCGEIYRPKTRRSLTCSEACAAKRGIDAINAKRAEKRRIKEEAKEAERKRIEKKLEKKPRRKRVLKKEVDVASAVVPIPDDVKDIELMLAELEEQEALLEIEERQYKDTHKTEYFSPFVHQIKGIDFIRSDKKTVLMVGANQIGKTVFGANVAGAFSSGCKTAWDGLDLFPSSFSRESEGRGVIGRILCNDWEKAARDTIVPKLKEWLPAGTYETKKNNVGVEYEFVFKKTGSKFTILTYKEDTKSHEVRILS